MRDILGSCWCRCAKARRKFFISQLKIAFLLVEEIAQAGRALATMPGIAKINFGALGNLVAQLHLHVVGRREGDPAWPGPVWGHSPPQPYEPAERAEVIAFVSLTGLIERQMTVQPRMLRLYQAYLLDRRFAECEASQSLNCSARIRSSRLWPAS